MYFLLPIQDWNNDLRDRYLSTIRKTPVGAQNGLHSRQSMFWPISQRLSSPKILDRCILFTRRSICALFISLFLFCLFPLYFTLQLHTLVISTFMWCIKKVTIVQIFNLMKTQERNLYFKISYLAISYMTANTLKLQSSLLAVSWNGS